LLEAKGMSGAWPEYWAPLFAPSADSQLTVPAFAAGLRHGTFSVVEGAGHYVPLERPAQLTVILREAITQRSSYP
jgi:pimeloyl-ACP methyl ester carboxylesterase